MRARQKGELDGRHDALPEAFLVVLVRCEKCVALVEEAAIEDAERLARRAGAMANDGVGTEDHPSAARPQTPAEVDVLVVGEIVLVEPADVEKGLAPNDGIAGAG